MSNWFNSIYPHKNPAHSAQFPGDATPPDSQRPPRAPRITAFASLGGFTVTAPVETSEEKAVRMEVEASIDASLAADSMVVVETSDAESDRTEALAEDLNHRLDESNVALGSLALSQVQAFFAPTDKFTYFYENYVKGAEKPFAKTKIAQIVGAGCTFRRKNGRPNIYDPARNVRYCTWKSFYDCHREVLSLDFLQLPAK